LGQVGSSDVARACVALGFGFGTELAEARDELESQRKAAKLRKSSQVVVPPEERARLQELMFAQAAQDMQK
jgi:hypothetical protein